MSLESIQFACSGCGKRLQVAPSLAGKKVKCPGCSALVPVPQPQEANAGNPATPASQANQNNPSMTNIDPALLPPLVDPLSPSLSPTLSPDQLESGPTPGSEEGTSNLDSLETQSDHPPAKSKREWDFLEPPKELDELGRLGNYRILRVLGSGGMGVVFYAEDILLKRPVALKVMLPRVADSIGSARQRFLREARATATLEHDNIVTIYQVAGVRDPVPFIAMQMLRGESLEKRLQREGKLPLPEVLQIGRQIAEGLAVAHRAKLIHRDIKPSNIWLEQGTDRVKLLDFGLALDSADAENLTQSGTILGTPAYMAPEQAAAAHDVDHRCDLFSLGCVLYRMSTGIPAFSGRGMMSVLLALDKHNPDPPNKLNNQLPPAFSGLVMQLLAKKPTQRPKSAQEVVDRLKWVESMIGRPPSAAFTSAETVSLAPAPKLAPSGLPKPIPLGSTDKTSLEPAEGAKTPQAAEPKLAQAIAATPPGGPPGLSGPPTSPLAAGEPPHAIPLGKPSSSGSVTVSDQTPMPKLQRPSRKWPVWLLASSVLLTIVLVWSILFFNDFFTPSGNGPVVKNTQTTTETEGKTTSKTTTKTDTGKTETGKPDTGKTKPPPLEFPIDPAYQVHYQYTPYRNFGFLLPGTGKTLTYNVDGTTNSILIRVDKENLFIFGLTSDKGGWISTETHPPLPAPEAPLQPGRSKNVWQTSDSKIRVTQLLDIIPGKQPVEIEGKKRWPLNTCLVAYLLENKDTKPHPVGLRLVLDTKVGSNDGVPFAIPGLPELVTTKNDFSGGDVPPFIQAVEFPDLLNPGTVAHLTLRQNGDLEPPSRVSLTAWDLDRRPWEIPVKNMDFDSCVVLYWEDQVLKPGEKRYLGFTYGLGTIFTDSGQKTFTQMGLTVDGAFEPGKDFIVMAYVNNPPPDQTLRLKLPEGLSLVKGNASQVVPQPIKSSKSLVSWTVCAKEAGQYNLEVQSNTKISQQLTVYITDSRPGTGLTKKIFE